MRKLSILVALASFSAALAAGASPAPAAAAKCVHRNADTSWKAVFAHFSRPAAANQLVAQLKAKGFTFAQVENIGCGDYAVVLRGLDTQKMRDEFAAEAASAGYPGVSYQTSSTDSVPLPKGTWRAVFGTFPTVEAASKLEQDAAAKGFRSIDIEYGGPRKWMVVVAGIPMLQSQAFAREARGAGFSIQYQTK